MSPLGISGGSQETTAAVAVIMETIRLLGGVLGAAAEPEPMSSDRTEPSSVKRRDRGNMMTVSTANSPRTRLTQMAGTANSAGSAVC